MRIIPEIIIPANPESTYKGRVKSFYTMLIISLFMVYIISDGWSLAIGCVFSLMGLGLTVNLYAINNRQISSKSKLGWILVVVGCLVAFAGFFVNPQ